MEREEGGKPTQGTVLRLLPRTAGASLCRSRWGTQNVFQDGPPKAGRLGHLPTGSPVG